MTSTDKTGDKLVDSIRRTKAGTGQAAKSGSTAEPSASSAAKPAPKPATKAAGASASKPKARKAPVGKGSTTKADSEAATFTFGRRVWPD
ncbi:MAG: hypothetical protein KDI82_15335 [Gammaproteobacteria bacterium]|nr:hypothetical protein [Gammaproteobacteria bacterium]